MLILVDGEVEEENKDTRYGEGAPGFPPHLLVDNAVEEPAVEAPANFPPRSSVVLMYVTSHNLVNGAEDEKEAPLLCHYYPVQNAARWHGRRSSFLPQYVLHYHGHCIHDKA